MTEEGFMRVSQLLGVGSRKNQFPILPIARPTLYAWIAEGKWPAPIKVGGVAMWSVATVREALKRLEEVG
jgi:predicted DNA-binding transcriptional regulator AlpA